MISPGINLVMTVIGFAVSTMFIVFVCTRLICARIQLNASRRSFPVASRSDLSLSILERGLHGLEPLVVANFPTKKYSDPYFSSAEDAQRFTTLHLKGSSSNSFSLYPQLDRRCTVCLAEYHTEDTLRILPLCGHAFHATCIDIWLQQHSTCPVCRISLREPDKKRLMQPVFSSAIRSQYPMNSLDTNSYQRLLTVHGLSSRAHGNHQMEPMEEDQFQAEGNGAEAGESNSILIEASQTTKDLGNKRVESPSNP